MRIGIAARECNELAGFFVQLKKTNRKLLREKNSESHTNAAAVRPCTCECGAVARPSSKKIAELIANNSVPTAMHVLSDFWFTRANA